MSLQVLEERDREFCGHGTNYPVRRTVPGFEGTQIITAFTSCNLDAEVVRSCTGTTADSTNFTVNFWTYTGVSIPIVKVALWPTTPEYDQQFANTILAADAAAPEGSFDNVIDLMDWLDRD